MNFFRKLNEHKKIISIGVLTLFFIILFFPKNSFAETVAFQQPVSSTATSSNPVSSSERTQILGAGVGSVTFQDIQVALSNASSTHATTFRVNFYTCVGGVISFPSFTCSGTNFYSTSSSLTSLPSGDGSVQFLVTSLQSATTTDVSSTYAFTVVITDSTDISIYGSTNSGSWSFGEERWFNTGTAQYETENVKDLYFRFGTNLVGSGQDSINISVPVNNSIVSNFPYWYLQYNYSTSTSYFPQLSIELSVSTSSGSLFNYSFEPWVNVQYGSFCFTPCSLIASTTQQNGIVFLPIGDYVTQARIVARDIYGNSVLVLAISSVVTFSISDSQNPLYTQSGDFTFPGLATTTGDIYTQCNQFSTWSWQNGICQLFGFFFQPHDYPLNTIKNTLQSFKSVFPFAVFYNIQSDLDSAFTTGTTSSSLVLSLPLPDGASFVLLSPTMLVDTVGVATKNKLFEIQKYFMWAGLVLMMWYKIV